MSSWTNDPAYGAPSPATATEPKKRGRPRVHADAAARQRAYLERHQLVQYNVSIPRDVADALDAYMTRQQMDGRLETAGELIARLVRTQLLRKR